MTINEVFEKMLNNLNPEAATGMTKTFQWNISGEEAGVWALQIVNGVGQLIAGGVEKPDVTVTTSDKTWIAIAEGRQNPMKAFMIGKMKINGDMTLAMKMSQLFPTQDGGQF